MFDTVILSSQLLYGSLLIIQSHREAAPPPPHTYPACSWLIETLFYYFLPANLIELDYLEQSLPLGYFAAKSLQSCPTLCDPIDGSPPGSPVPGILQARTLRGTGKETLPVGVGGAQ